MKKLTKRAAVAAVAVAVVAALGTSVGTTGAYFTTYAAADGSASVSLSESTSIHVQEDGTEVTVANNEGSREVYVRVKAYSPSDTPLTLSGTDWGTVQDDGYIYYQQPLLPGATTSTLNVSSIPFPDAPHIGDQFYVATVYETTPVLYHENNQPYANWDYVLDNGSTQGGDQ